MKGCNWGDGSLRVEIAHTQASSGDTFSDIVAERLVEGDVAFLEDAMKKLRVRSASATTKMRRW